MHTNKLVVHSEMMIFTPLFVYRTGSHTVVSLDLLLPVHIDGKVNHLNVVIFKHNGTGARSEKSETDTSELVCKWDGSCARTYMAQVSPDRAQQGQE